MTADDRFTLEVVTAFEYLRVVECDVEPLRHGIEFVADRYF